MFNKETGNLTFLSQNWFVNLSEYIWFFLDYFLIFEILFFSFVKTVKSRNLDIASQKHYALYSRSIWIIYRNNSQIQF